MDEEIIGIDLGTTNSCVSIWKDNRLVTIPDEYGYNTIPSVVSFSNSEIYVGREANKQKKINPYNTYYDVKRLIGKKINDISVINDINYLNFLLFTNDNNDIFIKIKDKKYKLEYISSFILKKLKIIAEKFLDKEIKKAVITVPAYFNNSQRQATINASKIAGLDCIRIINEPTASSLAYGYEHISKNKNLNILVYDLGGGTLDVSILNICEGVFEVLSSTGNTHLGGEDFDNKIYNFCINNFKNKYNLKNLDGISAISLSKLKLCCENAKKTLSNYETAIIGINNFYNGKDLLQKLDRKKFEELCNDLFTLCLSPVYNAFKETNEINKEEIDEIILVGGSTKIPKIKQSLEFFFNKKITSTNNPDEIVSMGAAIQAAILSSGQSPFSDSVVLLDRTSLSLGIETSGGIMNTIIPRNSIVPVKKKKLFTTDQDNISTVDINIYEGERSIIKDNFFLGKLELNSIEQVKKGIPKIEISFSLNTNNILLVSALNLNNNNSKELRIINKNNLSDEEINELIEESKKYKAIDTLNKNKKQLYYEIIDMCSNIMDNLNNEFNSIKNDDKEKIKEDIIDIKNKIKKTINLDIDDYKNLLIRIKKNYSTLILRTIDDNNNFKGISNSKISSTSVFDDKDEEDSYENLENNDHSNDNNLNELKELLVYNCESINEVLNSSFFENDNDEVNKLKELIEDNLLWVYVKENISEEEINNKINELTDLCNNIVDNNIIDYEYNKKNELEDICCSLKSNIESDMFNLSENNLKELHNLVEETLLWLVRNNNKNLDNSIYEEKIKEINNFCENIYIK